MKGLKVRSRELIIALILSLFCLSVLAESKICLKKEVSVYCEEELDGLNSFNGSLFYKGQYYEFSTRRSFSRTWCDSTLLKIQKVMGDGEFCMTFEEQFLESDLTLNSVKGLKDSWSYF
jgi:hypothetical protein